MTEVKLDISYEETRALVMKFLQPSSRGDFTNISRGVAQLAVQDGLTANPNANTGTFQINSSNYDLSLKYKNWIDDIFWDLVIEGILRPGLADGTNKGLPWYHVSEYGKSVLANQSPQPYDPDGYLARAKAISNMDNVIITYLEESLKAFRIHCLLSSVITLGCASEKAILILVDACCNSLSNSEEKSKFIKNTDTISIKKKHDELQKLLKSKIIQGLPYEIKENLDTYIDGLFSVIRQHRNETGHPSGKVIKREHLYSLLVVFPSYLEKVYALINWLSKNSI